MDKTDRLIKHHIQHAESAESQAEEKEEEIRDKLVLDLEEIDDLHAKLIKSLEDSLINALYSRRNQALKRAIAARGEAIEYQKQSKDYEKAIKNIEKLISDYKHLASIPYAVQKGETADWERYYLNPIQNNELLELEVDDLHILQGILEINDSGISNIEEFAITAMDRVKSTRSNFQVDEANIDSADKEFINTVADKIVKRVNDELISQKTARREFIRDLLIAILATSIVKAGRMAAKASGNNINQGASNGDQDTQSQTKPDTPDPANYQDRTETFVLRANKDGWMGIYPALINGAMNPTLHVPPDETFDPPLEILLENGDGAVHDFIVLGNDEEKLAQTGLVWKQGEQWTVSFDPEQGSFWDPDKEGFHRRGGQYFCPVHSSRERGKIAFWIEWNFSLSDLKFTFTDQESDGTSVVIDEVNVSRIDGFIGIYDGKPFEDIEMKTNTLKDAFKPAATYKSEEPEQLGISEHLHQDGHTKVEVPLNTTLEPGEHRLAAIAHSSSQEGEIGSATYHEQRHGKGPFINWSCATVTVTESEEESFQ